MRKIKKVALLLSALVAVGLGLLNYIGRLSATDHSVFVDYLQSNKLALSTYVLVLGIGGVLLDLLRNFLEGRYETVRIIDKLLNSYAKALFDNHTMNNRLTLFKRTRGWSAFLWGIGKQKIFPVRENWSAFRALFKITWSAEYLRVYLRPQHSWNRKSAAAFRISDDPAICEGVAGLIWRQNSLVKVSGLRNIQTGELRDVASVDKLDEAHPVRQYAESTNLRDIVLLRARKRFAKHFVGTVIENGSGERWGVLLLDSEDENCPLATGPTTSEYQRRFEDCALIVGKIVE